MQNDPQHAIEVAGYRALVADHCRLIAEVAALAAEVAALTARIAQLEAQTYDCATCPGTRLQTLPY